MAFFNVKSGKTSIFTMNSFSIGYIQLSLLMAKTQIKLIQHSKTGQPL